ncbi:MAG: DNA alkylation repair protein [Dehalococcoidia bacterium]|jgi:3-methyladenine DNA glycosylase AlkD|nr:DNA alkylation repair protein [Dehalococcoidia bacterium]
MDAEGIVERLRVLANPGALEGMSRYGIATDHALGVSMPQLRALAKAIGRDHELALALWGTGIHDARILASLVDSPVTVTEEQMEAWVTAFDSWDVCDQCVMNLFARTHCAERKAHEWSTRAEEFVKRAGFVIMARLASTERTAVDAAFVRFLAAIERESTDERNYVKKGVNWALREIGARNATLNASACDLASRLSASASPTARWIGRDALRELQARASVGRLRSFG